MMWRSMAVAVAALVVWGGSARANDGVFGGTGVHPVPMSTTAVRMVDEIVTLRLDPAGRAWNVECSFVFENTTDEETRLTVGFPFPTHSPDEGDVAIPTRAKAPKAGEPLVWDFTTTVRGKAVKARRSKTGVNPLRPDLEYGFAYLWDVTFAPREQVTILNTYRHGVSEVVGGLVFASYVVSTGSTWKGGKIGNARISASVPGARYVMCHPEHAGGDPVVPGGYHVSPLHGGPGLEVHWNIANFEPKQDVSVCFQDLDDFAQMQFATDVESTPLEGKSAAELRLLRNEVYALHGYSFKDPELRAHFAKKWWYVPDPGFSPDKLTAPEREFVARVKAAEAARK